MYPEAKKKKIIEIKNNYNKNFMNHISSAYKNQFRDYIKEKFPMYYKKVTSIKSNN